MCISFKEVTNVSLDISDHMIMFSFFMFEMKKQMNWPLEQRLYEQKSSEIMINSGVSKMIVANNTDGLPVGFIIFTDTNDKRITRLNSIMVSESYRLKGIGKKLVNEIRQEKEIHSYSTPASLEWYKKIGFRYIRPHKDGTFEVTTANYNPEYNYTCCHPVLDKYDLSRIQSLKNLEKNLYE